MKQNTFPPRLLGATRQTGAALIVSLLLLTTMTIAGLAGMQSTVLVERMSGNMRDKALAFEAAELALDAAEGLLDRKVALPSFTNNGTAGFFSKNAPVVNDRWKTIWTNTGSITTYQNIKLAKVHSNPAFFIEELPYTTNGNVTGGDFEGGKPISGPTVANSFYRVTARGTGGTDAAEVVLQSFYRR